MSLSHRKVSGFFPLQIVGINSVSAPPSAGGVLFETDLPYLSQLFWLAESASYDIELNCNLRGTTVANPSPASVFSGTPAIFGSGTLPDSSVDRTAPVDANQAVMMLWEPPNRTAVPPFDSIKQLVGENYDDPTDSTGVTAPGVFQMAWFAPVGGAPAVLHDKSLGKYFTRFSIFCDAGYGVTTDNEVLLTNDSAQGVSNATTSTFEIIIKVNGTMAATASNVPFFWTPVQTGLWTAFDGTIGGSLTIDFDTFWTP